MKAQPIRRAIRTAVYVITVFVALGCIAWIIDLMREDAPTLRIISTGLLGIVLVSVLGYVAENITQRMRVSAGPAGVSAEIGE